LNELHPSLGAGYNFILTQTVLITVAFLRYFAFRAIAVSTTSINLPRVAGTPAYINPISLRKSIRAKIYLKVYGEHIPGISFCLAQNGYLNP
jgi:hypothetical protein